MDKYLIITMLFSYSIFGMTLGGSTGGVNLNDQNTGTESEKQTIQSVIYDDLKIVEYLLYGSDAWELNLTDKAYCYLNYVSSIECAVDWDYDSVDTTISGIQYLYGSVSAPAGYQLTSNQMQLRKSLVVGTADNTPAVKANMIEPVMTSFVVERGASTESVIDLIHEPGRTALVFNDGSRFWVEYSIDESKIDTSEYSSFSPIVLDIPDWIELGENAIASMTFHVLPSDTLEMIAVSSISFLSFEWLYDAEEPILWVLMNGEWIAVNNGEEYTAMTAFGFFVARFDQGYRHFYFYTEILEMGVEYQFKIEYQDQKFSNVIRVTLDEDNHIELESMGGDRVGSDRDENDPIESPPLLTQPDDKSGIIIELSGSQLIAMIAANPNRINLLFNQIPVVINTKDLSTISIAPDDIVNLRLASDAQGYYLGLYINNEYYSLDIIPEQAANVEVPTAAPADASTSDAGETSSTNTDEVPSSYVSESETSQNSSSISEIFKEDTLQEPSSLQSEEETAVAGDDDVAVTVSSNWHSVMQIAGVSLAVITVSGGAAMVWKLRKKVSRHASK